MYCTDFYTRILGIFGQRLIQVINRTFGSAINHQASLGHTIAAKTFHIPDLAIALGGHTLHGHLIGENQAGQVGGYNAFNFCIISLPERRPVYGSAGIIDPVINTAKIGYSAVPQGLQVIIGGHEQLLPTWSND